MNTPIARGQRMASAWLTHCEDGGVYLNSIDRLQVIRAEKSDMLMNRRKRRWRRRREGK